MPTSSTVIIIRHAEKSAKHKTLSHQGLCRAHAYVQFFNPLVVDGEAFVPDHIYATASTHQSLRPTETVELLALQLNLEVHNKFHDDEVKALAEHLSHHHFTGKNILVCWHHGRALELAAAFGVRPELLAAPERWPEGWDDTDFGRMLVIRFDAGGRVDHARTYATNQRLMATDVDPSLLDNR